MNKFLKELVTFDGGVATYDEARKPDEQQILDWFIQILLAMEETHSLEMTHRNFDTAHIYLRKLTKCQEETGIKCEKCRKCTPN